MLGNKTLRRIALFVIAIPTLGILQACESTSNFAGNISDSVTGIFGGEEEERFEGNRISILQMEETLHADNDMQDFNIVLPPAMENSRWEQSGGIPGHALGHLALGENLSEVWKADIGAGSNRNTRLTAQPLVMTDRVITLDTHHEMSAFDRDTGQLLWRSDVLPEGEDRDVLAGGMAIEGGKIYVTTGFARVMCVDSTNGEIIWEKRIPAPSRAAPTVADGRVFVLTIDNQLLALEAEDGTRIWQNIGISEATALLGAPSPALSPRMVVVGYSSGEIVALRPENGAVIWQDNLAAIRRTSGLSQLADIRARPIIDRGLIIGISHSGRMLGIEERSGLRVWQVDVGGTETPWAVADVIYLVSNNNEAVVVHRQTGSIIRVVQLPEFEDEKNKEDPISWVGPVLGGGQLHYFGSNGHAITQNAITGELISEWRLEGDVLISPVIAAGMLFVLSENGVLTAYK